ncbi:MAG: S-adenosylmethionine:tRNA ribosyltransferase-isomerase [Bacteroidetes bacterium]|nr:S-adenosylmethionine:tRNA ribosyltransferase-isomerase [Bacteroidota bacterium]
MAVLSDLDPRDFDYPLPPDKIAQFPLEQRDRSKLLLFKDHEPSMHVFKDIANFLPDHALLIYNQTRVIQARLIFRKESGARIEIFLLEPVSPTREIQQAFECSSPVRWNTLVGNSKKWKSGDLHLPFQINGLDYMLYAQREDKNGNQFQISFTWDPPSISFSEVLEHVGKTPLPPYMNREARDEDKVRYQTIYARNEGSVAAPTAGLHFTSGVFDALKLKGIQFSEVTLHVGAGTFKPISTNNIVDHEMHTERIFISKKTIERILENIGKPVIVVGTTTMRSIESLYWHGVKILMDQVKDDDIHIHQWDPYQEQYRIDIPVKTALDAVLELMDQKGMAVISGQTQLMIVPGYHFKIADILITNFHMPRSTLLMLVAAFIGHEWKDVYRFALQHEFRFLSYGDSCLFFKKEVKV